jgi:integrase
MASKSKFKIDSKRWPGVYGYESEKRKISGKPDICFYIAYKIHTKLQWEKIGWKTEGYTPQIAAEIRSERIRKIRHGGAAKTSKEIAIEKNRKDKTINEIANAYFISPHGLNIKGRRSDFNRFNKNIKPLLGTRRASSLALLDIDRIKSSTKKNATATVYNILELLRRLINYGVKNNLCDPLPFLIKLPQKNNEVTEYLKPDEANRLMGILDTWHSQDVARMLKFAMMTGLRRGEIFKLEERDLDFTQELIKLRNPKGGLSISLPMSLPAKKLLEAQLIWKNNNYPDSPFIFPGRYGKKRVSSNAVQRIKKAAALPEKFRIFHGLRHHFAVTLANSGEFSLDMIGELLTHKSLQMTKRYGQFLPDTMKNASNRAAELIQGSSSLKINADDERNISNG